MTNAVTGIKLAFSIALLSTVPAFNQTPSTDATPNATSAVPVAHVYVQTIKGVKVYAAEADGRLTLVEGSSFADTGQMEASNGKYLISVGTNYIHTYTIEPSGGVGRQAFSINTQNYGGAECGNTDGAGSVLDHTGKYLYVQLWGAQNAEGYTICAAWQSYLVESNGDLQFLGFIEYDSSIDGGNYLSTIPSITSNDKFAYGVFGEYYGTNALSTFMQGSNGVLEVNQNFTEIDPKGNPDGGWYYYPVQSPVVAADPSNHLAVLMFPESFPPFGPKGPFQLASYTINGTGGIASTNTWTDMPVLEVNQKNVGLVTMGMSPSGKLLAVAGYPGLQVFHFNGGAPITSYNSPLLPAVDVDQLAWDNNNHLYALSYSAGALYVYTVTPTSIGEAPGSPYKVQNAYGIKGLVVVPKS
jgi:hypothetical protein